VAVAFLFIGFLPVLVDDRRRALQDFLARTVVIYEEAPVAVEGTPEAGVSFARS
jgi:16S rRNA C1402 (ribose-2'-O) methylase RsmI